MKLRFLRGYFFGPSWPFGAIFVVGVRLKNIFGTYLCRQSTLVLKLQPYLYVFNSAKFGALYSLFGPFRAIFGVGVKFKNFFGTYLHRLTTLLLTGKSNWHQKVLFWSVGRLDGQAGNTTSTAQLGLELGLSLAIKVVQLNEWTQNSF